MYTAPNTNTDQHQTKPGAVKAFCVPPCYLLPRTLSTSVVCSPFSITINMIAEYEYRNYPKHA